MENKKTGKGFELAVPASNYLILMIIIFLTNCLLTTNDFPNLFSSRKTFLLEVVEIRFRVNQ